MKKVVIHSKRKLVIVNGRQIPRLLLTLIRGAIGKKFVVKHYKGRKIVITKYPDMSGIIPSAKQRLRRELFREAVEYAKWIVEDEERKKAFRNTLPRRKQKRVFQAAIQMYMRMEGDQKWLSKQLAVKAVVRSVKGGGVKDETLKVKGGSVKGGYAVNEKGLFELRESWKVIWQNREKRCLEGRREVLKENDLMAMRI